MIKTKEGTSKKGPATSKRSTASATDDTLHHLAFDNSIHANIISRAGSGKIISANRAARKLLGYSKKELLTKSRASIFDINETSFKMMLKQRTAEGHSVASVTAIKKNGKLISSMITSAVFMDEDGIEKAITTITDMNQSIRKQKDIDIKKDKLVADQIVQAESKQKKIDVKNEKKVAHNINLARSKQKKIDVRKEKIVAHNIVLAKSKQKSIDFEKEKIVASNIVLAKSKQKKIDIKKEKIVAHDIILALAVSDAGLAENNLWIKHIAKASYDVMWDWDIITDEVYIGDSLEEVFGYKLKNNTIDFEQLKKIFLAGKALRVEENLMKALSSTQKNWSDAYRLRRYDGSVASVISRASILRDDGGKAIRLIGATQDVSKLLELEKKLETQIAIHEEDSEKFILAAKLSFDVIWDWNLQTNEVFLGDGFEELFGYTIKDNKGDMITDWVNYLHPDDRETVIQELQNSIRSTATHWEHAYRVSRADGSIAKVYVRASIIRHPDGKAYRMIGAMQDLSRQNELEEKLEDEIRLKEKQIAEAKEDAKDMERADIGKELHDNINQLLGASKMYLEMAKKGGGNSKMYLNRSSEYTLEAIEEIRKLTKGLTTDIINNLGLSEAINNLAMQTMEINPLKIACSLDGFTESGVNNKFKLNVFRIVQEELNNILKHARATAVKISLSQNNKSVILAITDNGVGFDTGKKHPGIGIVNIKSRAASYNGTADFVSKPGQGCVLTVTFPNTGLLKIGA